ncbi:hypothetical protein ACVBEG_26780 [Pseudomonas sp. GG8]
MSFVIIREEFLLGACPSIYPTMLNYGRSPPTTRDVATYADSILVLSSSMASKSGACGPSSSSMTSNSALYDFIDASGLYSDPINEPDRWWMNVPIRIAR